ncbi:protein adenylyltransferase SelO [Palleronia sp. LCG004]|uniref:protein adenylyltransferase SelO n=1 Tax=Palleronia sp. LCG004 TaxID=3079304 RepID=UPI00294372F0|nr:YdiU family protein [Palleronia sp. LCG004]WOI54993.1 YdiU family protein [Palleronia sp. LCG004]
MTLSLPFDNSYSRLPERFFTPHPPTPVADPTLIALNVDLAREIGLDADALGGPEGLSVLSGNAVPEGSFPLAQVYAGHQFGGWVPQLGDGRAVLLGEIASDGHRRDLQLKGSGPTPYSRRGDGRSWLGPVLREYLVSEAMHALGVPTTRALAAVSTGETVLRERPLPGAILTRVAQSHIRVGTFQYFAARRDVEAIRALAEHVIARHYPEANDPWELLDAVIDAQTDLIARWMGVGFIHGVMNTDNMSVAGETIDYGPCAFMDAYHPDRVFSSIDQFGRYAYARQPDIAAWNLAQFASALLPILGQEKPAIERATEMIHSFPARFGDRWLAIFRSKLGLATEDPGDADLIGSLLDRMASGNADFTLTFRGLADRSARACFSTPEAFDQWAEVWAARAAREKTDEQTRIDRMASANPAIIPRNHRIEAVIAAAVGGDYAPFHDMHTALGTPFADNPDFALPPEPSEIVEATFCGT